MEGGNANVVGIELRATWSMQGCWDANVIGVQIQGGHGLRRAVGQELCHGGRVITFSTHDSDEVNADRGCHSLREGEVVSANRLITSYDSTGGGCVVVCN